MANKTWNGGTGTWATAGNWTPSGIPLNTDDIFINAGSVTLAGQTCNNLNIGGTCTITGTSLTVNGTFTVTTGTVTWTHTSTTTFNGSISNSGGSIQQTGTGNFTIAGTTSTTANFGTNSLRLLNVTKTGAGAVTFQTSAVNVTNSGSATTSIFTFNSGTITQNVVINCCASVNNGTTSRTWAMNANLNITAAGDAVTCNWNHSGQCTLSTRTGKIVITGLSNGASGINFPTNPVTAAGSANSPNVRLEGTNVTWTMNGSVNNFEISGTCTTASAVTVWGTVSGITATYYTFTGCNLTFYNTTNLQTITQNMGTVGTFGNVIFNCLTSTTCTYTINSLAATNITTSGTSCTYIFGVKDDNAQTVSIVGAGTITLSATTATHTLNNVRGYNMNLNSTGTYACYNYTHNSFTNPATAGTVSHNNGTLTMKSGYTMTTWTFSSGSGNVRALTFEDNSYIKTLSNGSISTSTSSLTSSCAFDNAGFLHQGTGSVSITGTPASQNAAFNLTLSTACNPGSSLVRNLTILDGTVITANNTVTIYKDFTGTTTGAVTGLAIVQAGTVAVTINYSGTRIASYTNAIVSITQTITQCTALTYSLTGNGTTYNLGVTGGTSMVGASTGTISLGGNATTVHNIYNVIGYNLTLGGLANSTYNLYNYSLSDSAGSPPTAGTVSHSTGTLVIKTGTTLTTWAFSSASGNVRALTFENNSYIKTLNNGTLSVSYSSLTLSCAFDTAGFLHESTGSVSITGTNPASQNAAPNLTLSTTCAPGGSIVRNLTILDGTVISANNTVSICKNFTGYTSGTMTGLTVAQFLIGGTVNYTGNPIAAYNNAIASITQTITQCTAVGFSLTGNGSTYNLGVTGGTSMSLSTNGTITLGGNATTVHNLYNVRGYNLTLSGASTCTYNCYYYEHNYYNANPPTAGTVSHSTGTLVIKTGTTLTTWAFTSTSGSSRALTFENNSYITTLNNGGLSVNYSGPLTGSCAFDNAGFLHPSSGTIACTGTPSGNADTAFNFWFSTPNNLGGNVSTFRNLTIVDGASVTTNQTLIFCKKFTGYTSSSMANLTVQQSSTVSGSAYVDYGGSTIAAFTSSNTSGVNQYIYNLNAPTITLGYTTGAWVYIGSDGTNHNGTVSLTSNGTVTLGGACIYYIYNLRGYNATLSNTGTYNCYYYEHNYYNTTGGTVTHTAGTLVLKTNLSAVSMTTWTFTSVSGTRGITFETDSYITNFNTGAINYQYGPSLSAFSAQTQFCGFIHGGTGQWQADFVTIAPTPNACFNFYWGSGSYDVANIIALAGTGVFYARNLGNQGGQLVANNNYTFNPAWGTGSGCFTNTSARTIYVAGDVLLTGESGISVVISNRTQWQQLNITFFANDGRTQKFSTLASWYNGSASLRIGTVTLDTTFNGTLQLGYDNYNQSRVFSDSNDGNAQVTNFVHNGGTLDIRSRYLYVESQYSSTSTNATNKSINSSYATINNPAIYINGTTGTTWSFNATDSLTSNYRVWVYVRGGTVSHGSSTRSTANQPSFNLLENAGTYTLAPTTAFQVSSLIINNYTVPTDSVWTINGPEFTVYTGGLAAPAAFTVNIIGAGTGNSSNSCQITCNDSTFAWPTVNFTGKANIASNNWNFKNININTGANVTTSSGVTVNVSGTLGSSNWSSPGTLNINNSTWVFTGATAINYVYQSVGFTMTSDSTGTVRFNGLNGTNQGDQSAGFYTNFGGKIVNNISYDPNTGVGTLYLTAGFATNFDIPTASQIDFNYTTSSVNFYADRYSLSTRGFPIKGSTFNIGTSSSGYRYIRSRSGNWSNWGIYNTESSIVSGDYLNIAACAAKGGSGWYAGNNSINGGGTTGWIFSGAPTFNLKAYRFSDGSQITSTNEGMGVGFDLATTNIPSGTTVPFTITGVTTADLGEGETLTGYFTINAIGYGAVFRDILDDYLTEGTETLTLSLDNGAASVAVTINDTSRLPTYSLARSAATVTEGDSFTITLTTTNLSNGEIVPYTITGVSSADINEASLTGDFTISSNSASLLVNTSWDYVTEGTETFTLTLNPTYGTGSAISVAINNLLRPTYVLSATPTSLNEGGNFTINLTTTDVANNTTVPYTITGVSSADINGASLTGNFTVNNNTASATFTTTQDYVTEGNETFVLTLNTIGTNVSVLLIDYTKTRTYSLSTDVTTTVTEGGSFVITLTTTNVFDGTLVPYSISGVSSADINNASLTGNFTINSNTGTQSFTTTIDGISEGTETFLLTLGSPASGSINVAIVDPGAGGTNFHRAFLLF
jgi:hypothetical protein